MKEEGIAKKLMKSVREARAQRKADELYEQILSEICDILEAGDVIEDFDGHPYKVGVLRSITSIVVCELRELHSHKEFMEQFAKITDNWGEEE